MNPREEMKTSRMYVIVQARELFTAPSDPPLLRGPLPEQSEGVGKRSDEEGPFPLPPERAKENESSAESWSFDVRGPTPATHLHILRVITTKKF